MKILFAVDGSRYTAKAAQYLANHLKEFREPPQLHLLYVHPPIPQGLALTQAERLFGNDVDDRYYKEDADIALSSAERILREHNIPFQSTHKVGDAAEQIRDYALNNKMDMVVMGSHGHGTLQNLVLGSVATKVMAMVTGIPILVVR